jgi:hypothetical protein
MSGSCCCKFPCLFRDMGHPHPHPHQVLWRILETRATRQQPPTGHFSLSCLIPYTLTHVNTETPVFMRSPHASPWRCSRYPHSNRRLPRSNPLGVTCPCSTRCRRRRSSGCSYRHETTRRHTQQGRREERPAVSSRLLIVDGYRKGQSVPPLILQQPR